MNWISVDERLPSVGERVLIFTTQVLEAVRYKGKKFNRFGCGCEPSHWMPLPKKPQDT